MNNKNLIQLHNLLCRKKISSLELTKFFLKRIECNYKYNCFININKYLAIKQSLKADQLISNRANKFLTGIPITIKDNFLNKNEICTSGSKLLLNYISPYNSTIVKKLKNLNMIILGETNMKEFSVGSDSLNDYYGDNFNGYFKYITSGGSCGGGCSNVALNLSPISIGSDTGGSVRQPAYFNNLIGFKPTYGLISRYGMISYSSSLDHPALICSNILDCAIILNSISGFDLKDNNTFFFKKEDYTKYINKSWLLNNLFKKKLNGLKIGISKSLFLEIFDYDLRSNLEYILIYFEFLGAQIIYLCFSFNNIINKIYYIISSCELFSNLNKFDGFNYGYNINKFYKFFCRVIYYRSRLNKFVKNRILIGNYVLSSKIIRKYFFKCKKIRRLIINEFQNKFKICDIILMPVIPILFWYLYKIDISFKENNYIDIYTIFANIAGLPSVTLPNGVFLKNNLNTSLGFQIIGNYFKESRLIQIIHEFYKNFKNF